MKVRAIEVDDVPRAQRADVAFLLSLVEDPEPLAAALSKSERRWLKRHPRVGRSNLFLLPGDCQSHGRCDGVSAPHTRRLGYWRARDSAGACRCATGARSPERAAGMPNGLHRANYPHSRSFQRGRQKPAHAAGRNRFSQAAGHFYVFPRA